MHATKHQAPAILPNDREPRDALSPVSESRIPTRAADRKLWSPVPAEGRDLVPADVIDPDPRRRVSLVVDPRRPRMECAQRPDQGAAFVEALLVDKRSHGSDRRVPLSIISRR